MIELNVIECLHEEVLEQMKKLKMKFELPQLKRKQNKQTNKKKSTA